MLKAKKFGTFSGVFTPSILTILGVIMYLRFPAIIGQSGLINTIGIIVIAHIISITTSLSVASLSTDKPVQNGGTYFMISRSLGLPIGGTLGLALFVGLSFSVSLYLIGFAESFLQYWDMDININTIRITGSIVLVAVTTITFISTSLAIKSQYFIMATIVLSLFSIFFGKHDFAPTEINMAPMATAAPFMVLFGIFFPAVTGFEAGVSMSGDLQNPKKSLPIGAMMAVGVGFIVYIGLAFFYAFTVDANALVNDPQILFKISLVPTLVIVGIWGATLSSALGSILGAPRILQAIAMDKIAPKFLAKGTGKTNEPRNALLLAFVIAEAGILIGELDVIARIVSMFFITTYAFLNLASAIESWSSSDFRPAFKIPRFISVLGTLSAFIVMILLDFLALAGATIVLGLLYFYLQRKELILESGDAWSSFWTNLAKKALLNLSSTKDNNRNWRPNIILFSGGEKARPHLVELGLELTGKLGALTDFSLSCGDIKNNVFQNAAITQKDKNKGYFLRKLDCNTVEEGIKTVTNVYGFSGFEPNTVLMGWSKNSENINFLSDILKDLKTKKLNAVFLDYDKTNGFGEKESIDIWWNGKGNHLIFSLNILRFLKADKNWRDAKVRILIVNNDTSYHNNLHRNTEAILQEKRIEAEIKIVNDDFGSRTIEEIINTESYKTDLLFLGLSRKSSAFNKEYIQKINTICKLSASILLLRATEDFEEINLFENKISKSIIAPSDSVAELVQIPEIDIKLVKSKILQLDEDLMKIGSDFCNHTLNKATEQIQSGTLILLESTIYLFGKLNKELSESSKHEFQKIINKNHVAFLNGISKELHNKNIIAIEETEKILQRGISDTIARFGNYLHETTDTITIPYHINKKKKEQMVQFPYKKALKFFIETNIKPTLYTQLAAFEKETKNQLVDLQKLILEINDKFEKSLLDNKKVISILLGDIKRISNEYESLNQTIRNSVSGFNHSVIECIRQLSIDMLNYLLSPEKLRKAKKTFKSKTLKYDENFHEFSKSWGSGMVLLNNCFFHDILILSKKVLFKNIISKANNRIETILSETLFARQQLLIDNLNEITILKNETIEPVSFLDNIKLKPILNEALEKALTLLDDLPEELHLPELVYKESELISFDDYNKVSIDVLKSANYFIDVLFYEPLYRDLENLEATVKKATVESKEANSMLLFHISNIQEKDDNFYIGSDTSLFQKLTQQIQDEKIKVTTMLGRINHNTNGYISEAFSKLFYHSVIEASKKMHTGEREQKNRKLSLTLAHFLSTLKMQFNNTLVQLLNSASSGVILSKKYLNDKRYNAVNTMEILNLVDKLLPDPTTYNAVPVFYRNLMSSSSKITDEFYIPRTMEMNAITEAVDRHKRGYGGAAIVTGVHGAGKTTLTRYAVNHLFKSQNIHWINPPQEGTTDPDYLLTELKKRTGAFDDYAAIFNNLPFESAIVINSLELWWERRPGGGLAIQKIINLIKQYSTKVFFIINCNIHSYDAIQQIYNLNEYSLATISCSPFNSADLQQMILNRHKSSGITLSYNGKHEDTISQLSYSLIFNRYFNISQGIPGIAINLWKSNIKNINKDILEVKKPEKITPGILHDLPKNWLLLISIFILHKNIDAQKLSRISAISQHQAEDLLLSLSNSGLIVKNSNFIYSLGRNVEPLLIEVCKIKGLI